MKIKTKKKINLLELIQGVWEGDLKAGERKSDCGNTVFVWSHGFETYKDVRIQGDEVFTVEVCEELTKNTVLSGFVVITTNEEVMFFDSHESIDTVLRFESTYKDVKFDKLYSKHAGELHCVWTREHGIPEKEVLEVDTE